MKKKLIFFMLIIVGISFYYINYISIDRLDKVSLKKNYLEYIKLIKNKNATKFYEEFVKPQDKEKISEEQISKSISSKKNDYETIIGDVIIDDNSGFIDISTKCITNDCDKNNEKRLYAKWLYQNNKWYPDGYAVCAKAKGYDMAPEFIRAISLIDQKIKINHADAPITMENLAKCVEIYYEDLANEEGLFYFDKTISGQDHLVIKIDNSYKNYDDLSTASLLVHELSHALDFLLSRLDNPMKPCFDQESTAYYLQTYFFSALNEEERNSILYRINLSESNNQLLILKDLIIRYNASITSCFEYAIKKDTSGYGDCMNNNMKELLKNYVTQNTYYQTQCSN